MALDQTVVDRLRGEVTGNVFAPGDPDWDEARLGYNHGVDSQPALVVIPADEADVSATVRFASATGLWVAAQGSSHNTGALGDLAQTILIRTTALKGVEIDAAARKVRARAGAVWGDVVPAASEHGLAALHGSAPGINVIGYSVGGGLGWYSRKHGLACNRVTAFESVNAEGDLVRVDAESDPDLFWAQRGGGGGLGIITAIEFDLIEMPEVYAGALFFPAERASEVLTAWRDWTSTAPEEVTSVGRLMQFPPFEEVPEPLRGQSFALIEAIFIGDAAAGAELLAPLVELGPVMNSLAPVAPAGIADLHMDPPGPVNGLTNHALMEDLPDTAIASLVEIFDAGVPSPLVSLEVRHGGGALERPAPGSGALATLPGHYNMFAVALTMEPGMIAPAKGKLAAIANAVAPYRAGLYLNFCEEPAEYTEAFSAEDCERLEKIRTEHDPKGIFQATHNLG